MHARDLVEKTQHTRYIKHTQCMEVAEVTVMIEENVIDHENLRGYGIFRLLSLWVKFEERNKAYLSLTKRKACIVYF